MSAYDINPFSQILNQCEELTERSTGTNSARYVVLRLLEAIWRAGQYHAGWMFGDHQNPYDELFNWALKHVVPNGDRTDFVKQWFADVESSGRAEFRRNLEKGAVYL